MLGNKEKSILDKPEILRREATIEPVKPKRKWLHTFIWIVIIGALFYFLFRRVGGIEGIRNLFDKLLGNLLK